MNGSDRMPPSVVERLVLKASDLVDMLLEDRESGLSKKRPFHIYFKMLSNSLLVIIIISILGISWKMWQEPAWRVGSEHAAEILDSIHVVAIYFEVMLGALLFVLEASSEYVKAEYLLDAPSVFWLERKAREALENSKNPSPEWGSRAWAHSPVAKRVYAVHYMASSPGYVSTSSSIIYSVVMLLVFLVMMLLFALLAVPVVPELYIVLGVLLSAPLIMNMLWLFNTPATSIYMVVSTVREPRVASSQALSRAVRLLFISSIIIIFNIVVMLWVEEPPEDLWEIAYIVAGTAVSIKILIGLDRLYEHPRLLRSSGGIAPAGLAILGLAVVLGLPGLAAWSSPEGGHSALALAARAIIGILGALLIFFFASSVSVVSPRLIADRRMETYLRTYANYLVNEALSEEGKSERAEELFSDLVFLSYIQLALEGETLRLVGSEDAQKVILKDTSLVSLVRSRAKRMVRGDLAGNSFLVVAMLIASFRFSKLLSGHGRSGPGYAVLQSHNPDKIAEALIRLYGLSTLASVVVPSLYRRDTIRRVRSILSASLVQAMKRADINLINSLVAKPLIVLLGEHPYLPSMSRGKLEGLERALSVTYRAAAIVAGRRLDEPWPPRGRRASIC